MNLLVIGNGFDLACGLDARYGDFLKYCRTLLYDDNMNIKEESNNILIRGNIWIDYFMQFILTSKLSKKTRFDFSSENWIDFESEISMIIKFLDQSSENLDNKLSEDLYKNILNKKDANYKKLECFFELITEKTKFKRLIYNDLNFRFTYRQFRVILFDALQRLILQLEIYLLEQEKKLILDNVPEYIKNINPKNVLSFNYTHTAEKIYGEDVNYFYIHGECKEGNTVKNRKNNMVLGIDEYWTDERKNTHTNYAIFKKFVQRIQKNTNVRVTAPDKNAPYNQIYTIITSSQNKIKSNETGEIHIFGHSLDVTDKDILEQIFKLRVSHIVIYCLDIPTQGEYIANIIKIIGKEETVRRCNNGIKFEIVKKEG